MRTARPAWYPILRALRTLVLILGLDVGTGRVGATVGLAEWEVQTPGSNIVCGSDPFKAEHGICLRTPDRIDGKLVETKVCVSHIEWWQYYRGYVAGKTEQGFFLFREKDRSVVTEKTEAGLLERITQLGLKSPSGQRLTPKDGWEMAWSPLLEQLKKQGRPSGAAEPARGGR